MLRIYHDVETKQLYACFHIWDHRAVIYAGQNNYSLNFDPHLLVAESCLSQITAKLVEGPFDAAALSASVVTLAAPCVFFSWEFVDGSVR